MQATYLSVTETAKLIRAALKRSFPRTKFSVRSRSYSGGCSIDIGWEDGPAVRLVDSVVGQFQGGRFDGMIDLAYSVDHWLLPDGTATVASSEGTEGSKGLHAPVREWMPHSDAKLVRFGAKHVSTRREYSEAFMRRVLAKLRRDGFEWDGDEGPIKHGWPVQAEFCRITRNAALVRHGRSFGYEPNLSDVLHQVRHAYMVVSA